MANPHERPKPRRLEPLAVNDKEALAWLEDMWIGNRLCPICNTNQWQAQGVVFQLSPFYLGTTALGSGPLFPVWPVICNTCGYTVLFNAVKAGLVARAEQERVEDQADE